MPKNPTTGLPTFGSLTRAQKQMVRYVLNRPAYQPRSGHKERVLGRLVNSGVLIEGDDGTHSVHPDVVKDMVLPLRDPCVYAVGVIEPNGYGPVKFGTGTRIRPGVFQTASPYPVQVLVTLPGSYPEESAIHKRLKSEKLRNEWFQGPKTNAEVERMLNEKVHAKHCPCARCK